MSRVITASHLLRSPIIGNYFYVSSNLVWAVDGTGGDDIWTPETEIPSTVHAPSTTNIVVAIRSGITEIWYTLTGGPPYSSGHTITSGNQYVIAKDLLDPTVLIGATSTYDSGSDDTTLVSLYSSDGGQSFSETDGQTLSYTILIGASSIINIVSAPRHNGTDAFIAYTTIDQDAVYYQFIIAVYDTAGSIDEYTIPGDEPLGNGFTNNITLATTRYGDSDTLYFWNGDSEFFSFVWSTKTLTNMDLAGTIGNTPVQMLTTYLGTLIIVISLTTTPIENNRYEIWRSDDGVTFSEVDLSAYAVAFGGGWSGPLIAIDYNNNMYIHRVSEGVGLLSTDDGVTWIEVDAPTSFIGGVCDGAGAA